MILTLYFLAALLMVQLTGLDLLSLWLAFVPGGLYEVTLLALIFGFDIAFVAFHHTAFVHFAYFYHYAICRRPI